MKFWVVIRNLYIRVVILFTTILKSRLFIWHISDNVIRRRILFISVFFITAFLSLILRLILLSVDSKEEQSVYHNHDVMFRRDIIDRHGNILAASVPAASLFANPRKVSDPEGSVQKIKQVLRDIDQKKLISQLKSDKNFLWIKRGITLKEQENLYNLGLQGFEFQGEQKRIYTYKNLLSHVVGYVDLDMKGMAGIERYFDEKIKYKRKNNSSQEDKSANHSIQLSIDVRLQSILSEELGKAIKEFKANGGAGIVVNPNNGEILAMVSKPDFDPHYPGRATSEQLFNMASQGAYEIGSGAKARSMAIAFDTDTITLRDAYDLTNMKVRGFVVKDEHKVKGWQSVPQIFLNSSNIGTSQIVLETGKEKLFTYLQKFGLFKRVALELPERGYSLVPPYDKWNELALVTMSYGYGIAETPMHFVQSMIPIVNGGVMHPLTLIKQDEQAKPEGERVISENTSFYMKQLMRLTVMIGTGKKAEVKGYYVGGKTGTAFKAINGKYDKNKRISSFIGIIPSTKPEYMIYIVLDDPKGNAKTFGFAGGGWTAAPVVSAVFEKMVAMYGMKKIDENSEEVHKLNDIEYRVKNEI